MKDAFSKFGRDVSDADSISVSILFDANNDSVYSEGDLQLHIGKSTSVETGETTLASSLFETYSTPYEGVNYLADIEYSISGNEITFIVEKNQAEVLNQISTQTQVNISVSFRQDSQTNASYDYIPAASVFTQVQNISILSDDLLDYGGDDSRIDISEFRIVFE